MGNINNRYGNIDVVKPVSVCLGWNLHTGHVTVGKNKKEKVTVFTAPLPGLVSMKSFRRPLISLEKCSRNLQTYRNPNILKHMSCWTSILKFYLAVEYVNPLPHVLPSLNSLTICFGIQSILNALNFLHSKSVSHNNVCVYSVYVTEDCRFKLGALDMVCPYNKLTSEFLKINSINRYTRAIDIHEDRNIAHPSGRRDVIDIFAFGVFVCEVLEARDHYEIATMRDFIEYCKHNLCNGDILERPTFADILKHDVFKNEFMQVQSFLVELHLKSDAEQNEFLSKLTNKLKCFDEELVANQMVDLLLSRAVLLNRTAQTEVLPKIFTPRQDDKDESSLFGVETFTKWVCPKLVKKFSTRDVSIRMILLNYFPSYMSAFSKEELKSVILPQVLPGLKDTNDNLVSSTLVALSKLVHVLGSEIVVGGKRGKVFKECTSAATVLPFESFRVRLQDGRSAFLNSDTPATSRLGGNTSAENILGIVDDTNEDDDSESFDNEPKLNKSAVYSKHPETRTLTIVSSETSEEGIQVSDKPDAVEFGTVTDELKLEKKLTTKETSTVDVVRVEENKSDSKRVDSDQNDGTFSFSDSEDVSLDDVSVHSALENLELKMGVTGVRSETGKVKESNRLSSNVDRKKRMINAEGKQVGDDLDISAIQQPKSIDSLCRKISQELDMISCEVVETSVKDKNINK